MIDQWRLLVSAVLILYVLWRTALGRNPFEALLLLVIATLGPLAAYLPSFDDSIVGRLRVGAILIILGLLFLTLTGRVRVSKALAVPFAALVLVLFLSGSIELLWRRGPIADAHAYMLGDVLIVGLCFGALLLATECVRRTALLHGVASAEALVVRSILCIAAVAAGLVLIGLQDYSGLFFERLTAPVSSGTAQRAGMLGQLLMSATIACSALVVESRHLRTKLAASVLLAVVSIGLYASFSRSAWLGAAVGVAVVAIVSQNRDVRFLLWSAGAAAVVALSLYAYASGETLDYVKEASSLGRKGLYVSERLAIWSDVIQHSMDSVKHMILGFGPAGYYQVSTVYESGVRIGTPHNQYLGVLAGGGIIGIFLFGWFAFCLTQSVNRCSVAVPRIVAQGVLAAVLVSSFFGDYLFPSTRNAGLANFTLIGYQWLFVGLALGMGSGRQSRRRFRSRRLRRLGPLVVDQRSE